MGNATAQVWKVLEKVAKGGSLHKPCIILDPYFTCTKDSNFAGCSTDRVKLIFSSSPNQVAESHCLYLKAMTLQIVSG